MILINGRFLSQPVTGVQRFARQICLALIEAGESLHFMVPPGDLDLTGFENQKISVIGKSRGHIWEQFELPIAAKKLGRTPLLNLTSTAPICLKNQIVSHHDITYVRHPESFSLKFRMLYRAIAPIFLRRSLAIITVSEFSQKEISSFYKIPMSKFIVVPNAVDPRFVVAPIDSTKPYFLAVSSPNVHKNFERLVKAYALYRESGETRLVIVGSQPPHFAKQNSVPGLEEYVGRVTDEELISLYSGAKSFFFPSLYEGFGIPPLEAQAAGIPVASAFAASMPEVLGDSVLWFDPLSIKEIFDSMVILDKNESVRMSLSKLGRVNVDRFSWDNSAKLILRKWREITISEDLA